MEYQNKFIEYPIYTSRAFRLYFQDMDLGVLDIETTGLSPKNNAFILGGLVTPESDVLKVEQFFAESLSEEAAALTAFWNLASSKDVLITFNGQHFDLPFMLHRDPDQITNIPYNLDLLLLVKNYSPIRKFLPNLKQKTIEDYMGLWQYRTDEISGKESVDLYYQYLSRKDSSLKDKILLHNHDDILQLYRLLKVFEKVDLHKAMFHLGFPVKTPFENTPDVIVEKIVLKSDWFHIEGRQYRSPAEYCSYEYHGNMCHLRFQKESRRFLLELPIIHQSGMTLLDLETLGFDASELAKYPAYQEGFLILQNQQDINYLEINHFTKLFIERIMRQWTTNR